MTIEYILWKSFFCLLVFYQQCHSETVTVNINGNAQYTTIQQAIAAPRSDQSLRIEVYPGIYEFSAREGVYDTDNLNSFQLVAVQSPNVRSARSSNTKIKCISSNHRALEIFRIPNVEVSGIEFLDCFAPSFSGAGLLVNAGVNVLINNCVFRNNTGSQGGGLYVSGSGDVTISRSIFTNSKSNTGLGGGGAMMYFVRNTTVDQCEFFGNYAKEAGGGLFFERRVNGSEIATITNSDFYNNTCDDYGGGFALDWGIDSTRVYIRNVRSFNNYAPVGGGLATEQGSTEIRDSLFSNNIAQIGGGIYFGVNGDRPRYLRIYNTQILSNQASHRGGGLYLAEFTVRRTQEWTILENSLVDGNRAIQESGGAIAAFRHSIRLIRSEITNNWANSWAGAMYLDDCSVQFNSSIITKNAVGVGPTGDAGVGCIQSNITWFQTSIYQNFGYDVGCTDCTWTGFPGGSPCNFKCLNRDMCSVCNGTGACLSGCDSKPWSTKIDCEECTDCEEANSRGSSWIVPVFGSIGGLIAVSLLVAATFVIVKKRRNSTHLTPQTEMNTNYSPTPAKTDYSTVILEHTNYSPAPGKRIDYTPLSQPNKINPGYANLPQRSASRPPPPPPATALKSRDEIDFNELQFHHILGSGAFGEVWAGEWRMIIVAIKKIKMDSLSTNSLKDFLAEIEVMKNIKPHQNIIQLIGSSQGNGQTCIVTEYCANGSLDKLVYDLSKPLSKELAMQLIIGVAMGMFHLTKERIVHRDLAARNVLLDDIFRPKISDFGLARFVKREADTSTTVTDIGPILWMAPESLKDKQYSELSDVWSFGVLCYEIIARRKPYSGMDLVRVSYGVIAEGLHPEIPSQTEWPVISEIMRDCFRYKAKERPTFNDICKRLQLVARPTSIPK